MTASLRTLRRIALIAITVLVSAASAASFAESYRALLDWAGRHGLHGFWAYAWPVQVDTFIAVGEAALLIALIDGWSFRSRVAAWTVTALGLAASVAGNVGHIASPDLASRATAAVPPLAAAAALAVGLGVLKRVVGSHPAAEDPTGAYADLAGQLAGALIALAAELRIALDVPEPAAPVLPAVRVLTHAVPADAQDAARLALAASVAAGNPLSQRAVMARFGLSRAAERKMRAEVLSQSNGHAPAEVTG